MSNIPTTDKAKDEREKSNIIEKPFVYGNILKDLIFLILSLCFIVGVFFVESYMKTNVGEVVYEGEDGGLIKIVHDFGFFALEDDNVEFTDVFSDFLGNQYVFKLNSGRVWGDFSVSSSSVNIVAENVVIIPKNAIFDLNNDGRKLNVDVYYGDLYIGFLDEGFEIDAYQNEFNDIYMSVMLVPYGNGCEIAFNKVDDRLNVLFYSKLIKEFRLSFISSAKMEDDFVAKNLAYGNKRVLALKKDVVSDILKRGLLFEDSVLDNLVVWLKQSMTFFPEKKQNILFDVLFGYLNDAIFYANLGDDSKFEEKFTAFNLYYDSLDENIKQAKRYDDAFSEYLSQLLIFRFDDSLYKVAEMLMVKNFAKGQDDPFRLLSKYWLNVYDSVELGFVEFEKKFSVFSKQLEKTLNFVKDEDYFVNFLTFQNQLVENLILKYSKLYKKEYFVFKSFLEKQLLDLYEDGRVKDELKQSLISSKINFLKRLRFFFFDEKISVEDAKIVIAFLNAEIFDLMPGDDAQIAVIELFEAQMRDIESFWAYLKDSQYSQSKHFGSTHKIRYQVFLEDRDILSNVEKMFNELLGEEVIAPVSEVSVEDVIKAKLLSNVDVTQVVFEPLESDDQRFVEFSAVIGGYPFKAVYDRYYDNLMDIYAYDELIAESPIKLDSLLPLLKGRFADFAVLEEPEETLESYASRVARTYIANQIALKGFVVDLDSVSVVNETQALYRISSVYLDGFNDVLATFDYTDKEVTNLLLMVKGSPVVLSGPYSLEQLRDMIKAEDDFSPGDIGSESVDSLSDDTDVEDAFADDDTAVEDTFSEPVEEDLGLIR